MPEGKINQAPEGFRVPLTELETVLKSPQPVFSEYLRVARSEGQQSVLKVGFHISQEPVGQRSTKTLFATVDELFRKKPRRGFLKQRLLFVVSIFEFGRNGEVNPTNP